MKGQGSQKIGTNTKYHRVGEKIATKNADEVIVLSKNVQQYFLDTYGREVSYTQNGIQKSGIKGTDVIFEKWNWKKDEYMNSA